MDDYPLFPELPPLSSEAKEQLDEINKRYNDECAAAKRSYDNRIKAIELAYEYECAKLFNQTVMMTAVQLSQFWQDGE